MSNTDSAHSIPSSSQSPTDASTTAPQNSSSTESIGQDSSSTESTDQDSQSTGAAASMQQTGVQEDAEIPKQEENAPVKKDDTSSASEAQSGYEADAELEVGLGTPSPASDAKRPPSDDDDDSAENERKKQKPNLGGGNGGSSSEEISSICFIRPTSPDFIYPNYNKKEIWTLLVAPCSQLNVPPKIYSGILLN